MRQNEKQANKPLLEKLLEPVPDPAEPHHSQHHYTPPMATEDEFADGEDSEYEDDFEEEDDEEDEGATHREDAILNSRGVDRVESQSLRTEEGSITEVREVRDANEGDAEGHHHGNSDGGVNTRRARDGDDDTSSVSQSVAEGRNDDVCIAAVTTANDAGSTVSFAPSSYTSGTIPSPQIQRSQGDNQQSPDNKYENDSFESDTEEATKEQSVFITDANDKKVKGEDDVEGVTNQLARTEVKGEVHEGKVERSSVSGSASSMKSSRNSVTRSRTDEKNSEKGKQEETKKTQEYVRTESVVSLKEIR